MAQETEVKRLEEVVSQKDSELWKSFCADSGNRLESIINEAFRAETSHKIGYLQGQKDALMWATNYPVLVEARLKELNEEAGLASAEDDENALELVPVDE